MNAQTVSSFIFYHQRVRPVFIEKSLGNWHVNWLSVPSDKEAEICEGIRAYEEIKATNREP